ncbi:MAG: hypothetical protein IJ297_03830 [Clostridia bacterium]|nr:hypothetical protein [Clostridia bacterium]
MKKAIAAILFTLILCGCGKSVGIIGSNDGPTAIVVGNKADVQGVKLINVEGALYYDSGKNSSLIPRCGTLSGSLKKSGEEFEIPLSGESNFETSGYQSATSITKEVPLEGNWRIFKKLPDTNRDLSRYKYVLRLKGRHPNAVRDSELIVLTNDLTLDFEKVSKAMFSSQSTDWLDCYIIPVLDEDKWGLMLWAEDVTGKGLTLVCEQFGGAAEGSLQTGEWYSLEVMNEDYAWEAVDTKPLIDYAWNSVAYQIKNNDITKFAIDWEWLYGELGEGHYRIGREIMVYRAPGDFDKDIYYADFFVE